MHLSWWRRARLSRRASQLDIQLLEHDIYGEPVAPGGAANLVLSLRALGAAGTSTREMMHCMSDCTATDTVRIGDEDIVVICNLASHAGEQHHDVVHGDWTSAPEE